MDKAINSDAVVVGVGIAPERFKNFIFLWHKQRPGVGGWSTADVAQRVELKESASKEVPVRELLAAVLADENCRWTEAPEVPVFLSQQCGDRAAPVPFDEAALANEHLDEYHDDEEHEAVEYNSDQEALSE